MIAMVFPHKRILSKNKLLCLIAIWLAGTTLNLVGCASAVKHNEAKNIDIARNDFSTQARVEYVLQCMKDRGGQSYDTLYPCICSIDKLASKMSYEDYDSAVVFSRNKSTPGEAGSLFRDPPQSEELRERLEEAEKFAEESCYVKR